MYSSAYIFFFQAEDGLRAGTVTGVHTCALPISTKSAVGLRGRETECGAWTGAGGSWAGSDRGVRPRKIDGPAEARGSRISEAVRSRCRNPERSEERRVGKEWRCRGGR